MKQRIMAWLLTAALLGGLLPVSALAEQTAAGEGGKISVVTGWTWADKENSLPNNTLTVPNVSAENPAAWETVGKRLPTEINAMVQGVPDPVPLALGGWACPEGYDPDPAVLDFAKGAETKFELCRRPEEAAVDADVVITDVWASMGQEEEKVVRERAFAGYQVNDALMSLAHPGAMVQHCLPAHRGEEITAEVFETHANEIFDEAENRLHAQKAVMYLLMGGEEQ